MQIAARACCGITDRNHLTSLKQSADEIANLMNKDYLENNQTELENGTLLYFNTRYMISITRLPGRFLLDF